MGAVLNAAVRGRRRLPHRMCVSGGQEARRPPQRVLGSWGHVRGRGAPVKGISEAVSTQGAEAGAVCG